MRLDFAFLADAAMVSENGLFAVIGGGFDVLEAKGAGPLVKAGIAFVARVFFLPEEVGTEFVFSLEMIDPSGAPLPLTATVPFKAEDNLRHEYREGWVTIYVCLESVEFPSAGDYLFRFSCDGKPLRDVPVEIILNDDLPK